MLVPLYTAVLHTKYAMYCSHIFKSLERFAMNDFFKTIQQMSFTILSHYLQKKEKKTNRATAKLYILTNYLISIYNAAIQRDRKKEREGRAWFYNDLILMLQPVY